MEHKMEERNKNPGVTAKQSIRIDTSLECRKHISHRIKASQTSAALYWTGHVSFTKLVSIKSWWDGVGRKYGTSPTSVSSAEKTGTEPGTGSSENSVNGNVPKTGKWGEVKWIEDSEGRRRRMSGEESLECTIWCLKWGVACSKSDLLSSPHFKLTHWNSWLIQGINGYNI